MPVFGWRKRRVGLAVGVVISIGVASPVAADGIYPSDVAGTWTPQFDLCDGSPWSRDFFLGYVLNDQQDYVFDIPDPDIVPGETVSVASTTRIAWLSRGRTSRRCVANETGRS